MNSSHSKGDVRKVLYESAAKPGRPMLQVVLQRRAQHSAITLEKGSGPGDPWLAIPIVQVEAVLSALVRAYRTTAGRDRRGSRELQSGRRRSKARVLKTVTPKQVMAPETAVTKIHGRTVVPGTEIEAFLARGAK